jgi:hypothetical protein
MKRSFTISELARALGVAAAGLMLTSNLGAQVPVKHNALDVHLRIETDRRTYRVGDSISIRLALRNVSSHSIRFIGRAPTLLAHLRVYDAAGRVVEPTSSPDLRLGILSSHPVTLAAGKELILRWPGPDEWGNLRAWGYDLREPCEYAIVGAPGVVGPELTPDRETMRSNRAEFTIKP